MDSAQRTNNPQHTSTNFARPTFSAQCRIPLQQNRWRVRRRFFLVKQMLLEPIPPATAIGTTVAQWRFGDPIQQYLAQIQRHLRGATTFAPFSGRRVWISPSLLRAS
jgi:hypothetical protein